jgi:NADH-quinone oxidoreductase subunit M
MVFALWGVVMSAVYMLRAYRAIFLGEPARDMLTWTDPVKSLRWPVILLLAGLLIAGFAPGVFLAYVRPSIEAILPK